MLKKFHQPSEKLFYNTTNLSSLQTFHLIEDLWCMPEKIAVEHTSIR